MRLGPQLRGYREWIHAETPPPLCFIATAMNSAVVNPAERNRELVAHLPPERRLLGRPNMMRIRGLPRTDKAGLPGNEPNVFLVPKAARLRYGEDGLVEASWPRALPGRSLGASGRRRCGRRVSAAVVQVWPGLRKRPQLRSQSFFDHSSIAGQQGVLPRQLRCAQAAACSADAIARTSLSSCSRKVADSVGDRTGGVLIRSPPTGRGGPGDSPAPFVRPPCADAPATDATGPETAVSGASRSSLPAIPTSVNKP